MKRRTYLLIAGTATAGLAGCITDAPDDPPTADPTDDPDDPPNADRDDAPDPGTDDEDDPDRIDPDDVQFQTEIVAEGLSHPWALAFLPDHRLLATERPGDLTLINPEDGTTTTIDGTPDVHAAGQGGLLDLALHPAYPDDPWVYLTYAATNPEGASTTHLGRGRLDPDPQAPALEDYEVVFVAEPFVDSNGHYGSRVVFGPDEMLYMTVGDRQFKNFGPDHVSQDTTNHLGTTLRLTPDGSIPNDNPFLDDDGVLDEIFTYGHRNAQGLTIHPDTGDPWVSDHGEQDGDVIHILQPAGNYGWPIAHYGCTYRGGDPIGDAPHERDDVVNPVHYWECNTGGFPPAGMTFYDGDAFPAWQGSLFVGTLAGEYIGRFNVEDATVTEGDPLLRDQDWRIRDVTVAPDTGHLYAAVDDDPGPVVRIRPE